MAGIRAGNGAVADHAATAAKGEGEDDVNDVIDAVDIAEMDYLATSALKKRIEEKVREMREVGGPALREEFAEKAAAIGMTIDEAPGRVPLGFAERGRVHGVRGWPFKTLPVLRLPDEC